MADTEDGAPPGLVWHDEADRLAAWGTLDPPDACMCRDCVIPPEEGACRICLQDGCRGGCL